ncbi:MAG TPA: sulfite exporter TauE/SafE family protein, partial [Phenylobacterium sp.]|nr:sulfite exporter TauE/SafE family protein [Phenylobacterium sp.]
MALDGGVILLALASGAVVGLLLAVFGGGGSVLATPALLYVVGVSDPHVAIGTSAAAVAVNAALNLAGHARRGRVKWPCASVFALTGLAGALAGSSLAKQVNGQILLSFFALAMAAIALSMMRRPKDEG